MRDFLVIRRGHDDLTANDVVIVDDPRFVAQVGQLLARYLAQPPRHAARRPRVATVVPLKPEGGER
jgi:hypothetical protein